MVASDRTLVFNGPALAEVLSAPNGPVGLDLARRANQVLGHAVRLCPVDTGRLRSSLRWSMAKDAHGLAAIVGTDVNYAIYVHEGTRPHFPPPKALRVWAGRHGFDSPYPVCFAIAARGTRPRPFLRDALAAAYR